jgi:crotonobetainyl-CoA:carnitine CoA-transferase CaiB-like acyl-CoA transferase
MQPAREPAIPADEPGAPGGRQPHDGFLSGIRVIEVADELGEYCGKLLAGLGAEVIKVEPPGGERTRTYGPFADDEPGPDRSLYFWHYNYGKRSVVIDLDDPLGLTQFRQLLASADVLLDTRPADRSPDMGLDAATVRAAWPDLIHARISPSGATTRSWSSRA